MIIKTGTKFVEWIDPTSNKKLIKKGSYLISQKSKYNLTNGIPNFVNQVNNKKQKQVQKSFEEKWTKNFFGRDVKEFEEKIKPIYLEMMGLKKKDLNIFKNKIILEIGIGSGSSSRLWAPQAKEFHGIDISKAIYFVPKTLKSLKNEIVLAQADLNKLPYPDESFDVIVSNGVLHHTPNTKVSLKNTIKKLKKNGIYIFYIYKKKPPIREFCDDFIRDQVSNLSYNDALKEMKSFTELGKSLYEEKITIKIPRDIKSLKIKSGEYDLQRFVYDNLFKCFWNSSWGYDYSNMVNFDWYHPKFCWRHTKDEIKNWCEEFNLQINYLKELESGFACKVIKK